MKSTTIYEVSLTGSGQNFYTLYRIHTRPATENGRGIFNVSFVKNLSIDFAKACEDARKICGDDEETDTYVKSLMVYENDVRTIKRGSDIFRFGKHNGSNISDVYKTDAKYVEWVAKGGYIKKGEEWLTVIDENDPIINHAIALLVGDNKWIERKGKFMPVLRAENLDYLDSLTINPKMVDSKRVKGMKLKLITAVRCIQTHFGPSYIFKMIDENEHIYNAKISSLPVLKDKNGMVNNIANPMFENAWLVLDFTPSIWTPLHLDAKPVCDMKRMKLISGPENVTK